jgi:hypothetical protein
MLRFSLFTLLVAVLVVALFCAALANATPIWRDGAKLVLWFFLVTSLTATIASRERKRAIAAGMAVFGLGSFSYVERSALEFIDSSMDRAFVVVHGLPPKPDDEDQPAGLLNGVDSGRPSTTVQGFMRQPRPGNGVLGETLVGGGETPDGTSHEAREAYETRKRCFPEIAYMGLTVLVSLLGGAVGMFFYARSNSGTNKTPS